MRRTITSMVTEFEETLLIAIFIAYKTLDMINAMLSEINSLFWTNDPWANKLHPNHPHFPLWLRALSLHANTFNLNPR